MFSSSHGSGKDHGIVRINAGRESNVGIAVLSPFYHFHLDESQSVAYHPTVQDEYLSFL